MRHGLIAMLFALDGCDALAEFDAASAAAEAPDPETEAVVLRVVREAAEDEVRVSGLKVHDTIVCGVADLPEGRTGFYVDLEDEEAFFNEGAAKTAVSVACGG